MILRIQKSKSFRLTSLVLALSLFIDLVLPRQAFALTGGPAQPEFSSFTPIGTSDMVNLSSGDMSYNIPLMDVGGYPLNLAYSGSPSMDQEASHVGLGWNLSVGQINRNVRGIPDDFKGDQLTYENYLKPNVTVGLNFKFDVAFTGVEGLGEAAQANGALEDSVGSSYSLSVIWNNYNGLTVKPGFGISREFHQGISVGFNAQSGPDGLTVSPNVSLHNNAKQNENRERYLGLNFGTSLNSRQGLSQLNLQASRGAKTSVKQDGEKKRTVVEKGGFSLGSTISFTDPVFTPTKRVGMSTSNFTLNAEPGGIELFGAEGSPKITAYGVVTKVREDEKNTQVQAFGYAHTEKASQHSVLDFNREKDGTFSVNSKNLPITNYTYDIYSVQGQGVSGTYRPYRNQVGYVYDTYVWDGSFSGSLGIEVGTGNLFTTGVDFEATGATSHSGKWTDGVGGIQQHLNDNGGGTFEYERVHYKNVGDLSADNEYGLFSQTGNYQPVTVPIGGLPYHRKTNSTLQMKNAANSNATTNLPVGAPIRRNKRVNRNQTIYNLTKADNDNGIGYGPLAYDSQSYPVPSGAKPHHIQEVQIIRNDGARYVYGLSGYNTVKKEASFAVDADGGDCTTGLVTYNPGDVNNPTNLPNDKYLNRVTTPAYVHTHLLTSILSTDYQDIDGVPGPSVGDLGSYTKFSYTEKESNYKWRVPFTANKANYNEGLKTDPKDDRGNYVYGEKQLYYINEIETKTHVAVFHYSPRKDAKGVSGEAGGMGTSSMYKLDSIKLYSAGEYDGLGINSVSTPIKEVCFEYSYSLCPGVPNNDTGAALSANEKSNHGGKLTLKKVYFKYRNSAMGKYTGYKFNYGEYKLISDGNGGFYHPDEYDNPTIPASQLNTTYVPAAPPVDPENPTDIELAAMRNAAMTTGLNPEYHIKGYDSWGNYKPNDGGCGNLDGPTAPEFPFVEQDDRFVQDNRSAVWCMRKISLPSGGTIEVEYESDDYAYVQDREVMRMFKVMGAGKNADPGSFSAPEDQIYTGSGGTNDKTIDLFGNGVLNQARRYLYVEIENPAHWGATDAEIQSKFLKGIFGGPPIYFRFLVNTTKFSGTSNGNPPAKYDYITGYLEHEETVTAGKVFQFDNRTFISIPVKFEEKEGGLLNAAGNLTNKVHPVSKATWYLGRKTLNKFVYENQPNSDTEDVASIVSQILNPSLLSNLFEIFVGPNARLENNNIGKNFIAGSSWLRLNTYDKHKFGGGNRVTEIRMSDVWEEMNSSKTGYQTMRYGQRYSYALEDGTTSGVATYEPVGNKENPFVQPEFSSEKKLLAPDEENYVEMPFGECFFPSPQVTYSRVTVENVDAGTNSNGSATVKQRNKTGKVVTEFYTSKDFPTIVDQTKVIPKEDKTPFVFNLLKVLNKTHVTMSQGYVIHVNDMNGKQKSQRVYAEGQSTPISGVDYKYRTHTGNSGFSASSNPEGNKGKLNNMVKVINADGTVGYKTIGVETDVVMDFRENETRSETMGMNTNLATFIFGIIPLPIPMLLPDVSVNEDRFRSVSTTKVINTFGLLEETIAYDAGAAVYTKNLAWDAETGEVLVTETIDEFSDKYYTMNYPAHWYYDGMGQASKNIGLEGTLAAGVIGYTVAGVSQPADYLLPGDELYLESAGSQADEHAWVRKIQGGEIMLINQNGLPIAGATGPFKVIRSGRRNLQSAGIMNVTLMHNPLTDLNGNAVSNLGTTFLNASSWDQWRIINAGAVDYSQKWKFPCECDFDNSTQGGIYNPYFLNELGVWRTKSSRTYLTGRNYQSEVTPRQQGFFSTFSPMYKLSSNGNWIKDFTDWTYVAEVSIYSPYGFELENKDALDRYSAAQYGYNNTFPMAVGANTQYREIAFDGFEDYFYDGCPNAHFNFKGVITPLTDLSTEYSHTGKYSLKVSNNSNTLLSKVLDCLTIIKE